MGMDSYAYLAYGYDLGGEEHDWKFTYGKPSLNTSKYHSPLDQVPWFDEDNEDESFAEQLMHELLIHAGWEETNWQTDGTYFKRKNALEKSLGVEVRRYGSYDYSGYLLHTKIFRVDWGAISVLTYVDPTWTTLLNNALDTLGIVSNQTEPRWHLASFYG